MSTEIAVDFDHKKREMAVDIGRGEPEAAAAEKEYLTTSFPYVGRPVLLVGYCIVYAVFVPAFLLYAASAWLLCGIAVIKQHSEHDHTDNRTPFYQKAAEMHKSAQKVGQNLKFIRSRVVALTLIWVILNLSIPRLRSRAVLGSELWKWTLLIAMVVCGYHVPSLATSSALCLMSACGWFKPHKNEYFARGLRVSVNLVVHSWGIFLAWAFYFRTCDGLKTRMPNKHWVDVIHLGTWTFATLAIGAVLWLMKDAMLLVWKANVVYEKFEQRILSAGFLLYFLEHICGQDKNNLKIFRPKLEQVHQHNTQTQNQAPVAPPADGNNKVEAAARTSDNAENRNREKEEEKRKAKNNLRTERGKFYEGVSTYDIMQMTEYFIKLSKASSREDDGTSDVLLNCNIINPTNVNASKDITTKDLGKFHLEENDAKLLCLDLNREHLLEYSDKILYENFEKTMVRAHKNCLALGHTLLDALEVVKVLDKVVTFVLVALSVIAWLLLTKIATNKILVLIASPLLAATFVFGDTCKKTFEGVIFSFLNHPFDVGDLCVVDGLELEVKRMGIWTTTFILIATKEEVLHPNSVLATKSIVNLKGEPDPNDCVELRLDSNCQTHLVDLKDKITKFFKNDGGKRFEEATTMTIEEIGSCTKLTIRYQHVMSVHDVTHSQCHEKKRKQRSEFLFEMAEYMNGTRFNVAANSKAP